MNDVKNKPSRNGFDLSRRMAFTAKMSELLPVCLIKTMPGDKFKIRTQHFTRTSPVQSAAFVRIREYFDWFYVPYRMLWRQWQSMSVNMTDQPVMAQSMSASVKVTENQPYLMLRQLSNSLIDALGSGPASTTAQENYFGFKRVCLWAKLFTYFGYGRQPQMSSSWSDDYTTQSPLYNIPVDIFPIAAYHKIYNDYFRNSQWEMQTPYLWNFDYSAGGQLSLPLTSEGDYWTGKTIFDMEYCNVSKDLFFGILPQSQLGDVSEAPVGVTDNTSGMSFTGSVTVPSLNVQAGNQDLFTSDTVDANNQSNVYGVRTSNSSVVAAGTRVKTQQLTTPVNMKSTSVMDMQGTLSILALRQFEFLQKYKEIAQSGNQSYRDQIYKIWGVSLPDDLSDTCRWIDGGSSNIDISEVLNTNFSDAYGEDGSPVSQPWIKGKAVGVGDNTFEFSTKEHGVILCLYHTMPILDYDISGIDLQLTQTAWSDYPNPAFDKIGLEGLPSYAFSQTIGISSPSVDVDNEPTIGYVPRYIAAKTAVDRVCGGFSFGLNDWVAPIDDEYLKAFFESHKGWDINYNFFKASPKLLDSIFGVNSDSYVETDQFRVNAYFDIKAVRNLDYNGMPY